MRTKQLLEVWGSTLQWKQKICLGNSFLYKSYIFSTEISVKENSKQFWHFIGKSIGLPNYMRYLDNGSSNSDVTFSRITSNMKQIFNISNRNLSQTDIESSLLSLVDNTSIDYHGIANVFLKHCSTNISVALFLIFEESLESGIFLDHWKLSEIVHKSAQKRIYVTIGNTQYQKFYVFQSYLSPSFQTKYHIW